MKTKTKAKEWGGRRGNSGRLALPDQKKRKQYHVYMTPDEYSKIEPILENNNLSSFVRKYFGLD